MYPSSLLSVSRRISRNFYYSPRPIPQNSLSRSKRQIFLQRYTQSQKTFLSTKTSAKASSSSSSRVNAEDVKTKNTRILVYVTSVVIGVIGVTYASVPLYKVFCQATGFGGATKVADSEKAKNLRPVPGGRLIRVRFNADVSDMLPWRFTPQQADVKVVPGETALAFYTAENKADKNITGVATYNVIPSKAGVYFNKIQCFCFEEQRLRAKEEIDMPVFFFIDPEFLDDPAMENVNNITLSYTFFKTDEDTEGLEKAK